MSSDLITNTQVVRAASSVGIGGTPADTAKLDIQSTTQGFLVPRLTTTQRNAIVSPANALLIFNTTTNLFEYWDNTNTAWAGIDSTTSAGITALTGGVTATGPGSAAATVVSVGGSSAANVHSAELVANAATSANTVSTIVKRDGSGNFTAGTVTATQVTSDTVASAGTDQLNLTSAGHMKLQTGPANLLQIYGDSSANAYFYGAGGFALAVGGPTLHASAIMDVRSTTLGVVFPRMSTTQRDAISSPVEGLLIYNLTTHDYEFWNGSAWTGM